MHLLNRLPYPLPKSYIELLKISNGGYPKKDAFNFYDQDLKYICTNGVGYFCGLLNEDNYSCIIYNNNSINLPEFFANGLLIFAIPGGRG